MRTFRALILVIVAVPALPCLSQSIVFGSPNTREHMPDEIALASETSFEQQNFLAVARYLSSRLCAVPRVESSLGVDGPGSENSLLITGCQRAPAEYVGELIARYGHQKWALIFHSAPPGAETLFIVTVSGTDVRRVLESMRRNALQEGTAVVRGGDVAIYIWTRDQSRAAAIHSFAAENHAQVQEIRGKGIFIGDEDRQKAQQVLDQAISGYERRHHAAFSRELWSQKLRDRGLGIIPEGRPLSPAKTNPAGRDGPSGRLSQP